MEEEFHRRTWRWFSTRVGYLLRDDNPFSRQLAPQDDVDLTGDGEGE